MNLEIRPLKEEDYEDILCKWWKEWNWTSPPSREFLPNNGTGGYIVYDGDTAIVAGFLYDTNSSVAWCDWIISNINYTDRTNRKEAIEFLINTITEYARGLKKQYMYANNTSQPLINIYKNLGYKQGSTSITELIKTL